MIIVIYNMLSSKQLENKVLHKYLLKPITNQFYRNFSILPRDTIFCIFTNGAEKITCHIRRFIAKSSFSYAKLYAICNSGTAVTNFVFLVTNFFSWLFTSSAIFHGKINTKSGLNLTSADGGKIGMWLPGINFSCLAEAASETKGNKSG